MSNPKHIKIISEGGIGRGTKVIDQETGKEIPWVRNINIDIPCDGLTIATLEFIAVELEIEAIDVQPPPKAYLVGDRILIEPDVYNQIKDLLGAHKATPEIGSKYLRLEF